jgi:hypothetical protein
MKDFQASFTEIFKHIYSAARLEADWSSIHINVANSVYSPPPPKKSKNKYSGIIIFSTNTSEIQ